MQAHHNPQLAQQADSLYERYGKPLEATHNGKYVAISADGKTIIGASLPEVMAQAKQQLGTGNFVFKIGERSVGKWL
jgi:hypothetical protein